MSINYEDERFGQVESDKEQALTELEQTYGGMVDQTDKFYQQQIDASKQWADKQGQLQKEQTDFAIEQIEQQRQQVRKDYIKEQSGAYQDWQKQSARHGVSAEQMAAQGMTGTGYSESSQVSMYNAYQNRVATAREAYTQASLNFDNAIKDARLQNNSALAQIAYEALQQQLELGLQGLQYKNQLLMEQAGQKLQMEQNYYSRYMDVVNQINQEKAYALQVRQLEESIRQFDEELARLKKSDEEQYALQIQQLELQKAKFEEEKRQFEVQMAAKSSGGSGGGGGSGSASSSGALITKSSGSSNSSSNSQSIDTRSVKSLGYGQISGEKLAQLVKSGDVNVTRNGNTLVFTNNTKTSRDYITTSKYMALK